MSSPDQRIILVTGGNRGLGFESVKILSQRVPNGIILLASRSISGGETAVQKLRESVPSHAFNNVHVIALDITSKSSVADAVQQVKEKYGHLDVLINNSAIAEFNGDPNHREVFNVNIDGTVNVTDAFLPIITKDTGKVVVVSSGIGAWYMDLLPSATRDLLSDVDGVNWDEIVEWKDDWTVFKDGEGEGKAKSKLEWVPLETGPFYLAYGASKALINAWARSYAVQHPDRQIVTVCPGYCSTDMNQFSGVRPPARGAESIVWPVFGQTKQGAFYRDGEEIEYVEKFDQEVLMKP